MEVVKYEVRNYYYLSDMYSYLAEHFGTSGNCADSVYVFKRCFMQGFKSAPF
jgi:hypothetical protein